MNNKTLSQTFCLRLILQTLPSFPLHLEFLNDMCFSPYDDDLLVTCSNDGTVSQTNYFARFINV